MDFNKMCGKVDDVVTMALDKYGKRKSQVDWNDPLSILDHYSSQGSDLAKSLLEDVREINSLADRKGVDETDPGLRHDLLLAIGLLTPMMEREAHPMVSALLMDDGNGPSAFSPETKDTAMELLDAIRDHLRELPDSVHDLNKPSGVMDLEGAMRALNDASKRTEGTQSHEGARTGHEVSLQSGPTELDKFINDMF